MPLSEDGFISRVSLRHSISVSTVRTILQALRSGGGRMAQFSHPDFGGMSQWSPGMTMVGDMFNSGMKSRLDAVCTELADYLAETPSAAPSGDRDDAVSYRSIKPGADWWPADLGTPAALGSQNDMKYAVFPDRSRLAIEDGGQVQVYDTGSHRIYGVAQAQSAEQTLTFSSNDGLVRVKDLPKL